MLSVVVSFALVTYAAGIACIPSMCDNVKQPLLSCEGAVLEKGGFCGCTDICAKVEGEECRLMSRLIGLSMPTPIPCDDGLECVQEADSNQFSSILGAKGTCQKSLVKKEVGSDTPCQAMFHRMQFSFAIWKGQWIPKCDKFTGAFEPMQCNREKECFCVDLTGTMLLGTKEMGAVEC